MPQVGHSGKKPSPKTNEEKLRRALFGVMKRLGAFRTDLMPRDEDLLRAAKNYQDWKVAGPGGDWLAPPNPKLDENIPF